MSAVEIIAVVKDISVIIAASVASVVLLWIGYVLLRLYPTTKRTAENLERCSVMINTVVSQPFNLVTAVLELINRGLGMVEQFKKRERREDDE